MIVNGGCNFGMTTDDDVHDFCLIAFVKMPLHGAMQLEVDYLKEEKGTIHF